MSGLRPILLRGAIAAVAGIAVRAADAAPVAPAVPVRIAVLAHPVARGDLISTADFDTREATPAQAAGLVAAADAAGREAARNLAAGAPVRPADLVAPRLVRRGEPVTIAWRSGGLAITTGGRALSSGGRGEFVRVVTASTNRTLDAVVEGSGTVAVQ